jgi:Sec-independent protein translocase protein TatA
MQAGTGIPIIMASLSGPEIIALFVVTLLVFGVRHLDDLCRGLGRGGRIFRDEIDKLGAEAGRSVGSNFSKPVYEALTLDNQDVEFHDRRELRPISFRFWKKAKSLFAKFCQFLRRLTRLP